MMERMKALWDDRSPREQWMLGVMVAMLAVVILWVGVLWPLQAGQRSARDALAQATDRNADIRTKVKLLKSLPRNAASVAAVAPVDQLIGQAAGEAGLTLERAQAQGVRVDTISARPSATQGSLSVQAVLVRRAGQ